MHVGGPPFPIGEASRARAPTVTLPANLSKLAFTGEAAERGSPLRRNCEGRHLGSGAGCARRRPCSDIGSPAPICCAGPARASGVTFAISSAGSFSSCAPSPSGNSVGRSGGKPVRRTSSLSWQSRGLCGLGSRRALPFACPAIVRSEPLCTPEILERRLGARTPNAIGRADEVATFD